MRPRIWAVLFAFCILHTAYTEEVLTNVTTDTWGLLNNGRMVYLDYHYATTTLFWAEVTLMNLATHAKTVLVPTSSTSFPYFISFGASGNHLAYVPFNTPGGGSGGGGYSGGSICYLNYLNITTNTGRQLSTNTAWKEMVWVGGDIVTWVDYRYCVAATPDSQNSEIFLYDLAANQERRITTDHAYQAYPCTDGQRIAWIDYSAGYGKLFLYTIATGEIREVSPFAAGKNKPRISGNTLVWEDFRNAASDTANGDIYLYDITEGADHAICTAPGYQGNLFLTENAVVWEDYRNGNADIYGYDIAAGQAFECVTAAGYQGHPTLDGDTLCYVDNSAGQMQLKLTALPPPVRIEASRDLTIFNPGILLQSCGRIRVNTAAAGTPVTINIHDISGRRAAAIQGITASNGIFDMSLNRTLSRGVYMLELTLNGRTSATKAVVW